jgi:transposase
VVKLAKTSAVKARTQTINQPESRARRGRPSPARNPRRLSTTMLIRHCAQLEVSAPQDVTSAAIYTLRLLARRILALSEEVHDLEQRLTETITSHTPVLLTHRGVGPDTAAALLIAAGDNPDRLRSEASFAALRGVSPQQASSGNTTRHQLNRGGDRQANTALYRITLSTYAGTPAPTTTSPAASPKGKTRREAIRCLKRYIAREIYQILTTPPEPQPSAA